MIINKVINNNVLSTHDENNREIVLMGKGIGFQKKVGDEVAEDKIEKRFVLDSEDEVGKFSELIEMIPHNYLNLSVDIISYAQQVMPKRLSPSIYISLTDHINFLLERSTKGELFENPLFNEIKSFYPSEYLVGEKALELIESEAGIKLPQDEAASIALHFVIAEYNMGMSDTVNATTMQGGDIKGVIPLIGLFLVKAGAALIDNMALLFVIGVGVGLSKDNDGTGGVAALASWLMITTLLNTEFVTTIMPAIAENANKTLAFDKIVNPFIGILAGIIGSTCYNKFKDTKLPDWLSFFSGKRCVAIVAGVVSILVSVVLLFVWPLVFGALIALGEGIVKLDGVGAGLYAFFNRLLIPTGLHHALNNVFWFDTIGLGDLTNFWGGKTSADVSWSLGMYMSGFFPCMMFGVPGAALAMLHCAKDNKKKVAAGLLLSAAICAFVCGVTEPFEFGFMFLAPVLYLIYAILYGIFTVITYYVGFRAGFSFSAGCTDLVFSSTLPAASKTWLIIPLGIAAFIVFYVVFRFAITKFDLKTPGREDDDVEAEKQAELGNNDYTQVASIILEGVGGKENVVEIDNCITRLRLEVKDNTIVDEKKIKSAGVAGVLRPGKNNVQVIIGTKVQFVADEFKKLCK